VFRVVGIDTRKDRLVLRDLHVRLSPFFANSMKSDRDPVACSMPYWNNKASFRFRSSPPRFNRGLDLNLFGTHRDDDRSS